MFEFGTLGELFVIVVAVLVLFGPKEIPVILKTLGRWRYKIRQYSYGVRSYFDAFMREGEVDAMSDELNTPQKSEQHRPHPPQDQR